ncbi:hypothetical protein KDD17_00745 [Sulfitobacter albidus]|uniref:Uncharacterized protein n=1 Tax=Sulfitobacter albidus TaxID=2829501 RepID=A0A975PMB5_9RHOB|nr:hypothetical protein [Sulfitobacter albidus]QUJ76637.1 hypothetical protein KDD17_00745 [Sulfitobacter albidus]
MSIILATPVASAQPATLPPVIAAPDTSVALAPDQVVASASGGAAADGQTGFERGRSPALDLTRYGQKGPGSATSASIVNAQISDAPPRDIFEKLALPDPLPTAPILKNLAQTEG